MKRPSAVCLDSVFHVISHTPLICSTRSWPNSEAERFIQISDYIQFSFIYYFVLLLPPPLLLLALSCLYDKWNERFRSRSQLLRVVDIKDCQEEFPFYYRAKAAAKFKSFAKQNFDVALCLGFTRALREDCSSAGISVSHKRRQAVSRHSFVAAPLGE